MPLRSFILPNEREIFSRIAEGDEGAFSIAFYHYTARIYPFILKITRSEQVSEEIVQDVFVSVWKNRATLKEIESYQSWIFHMASNLSLNYLKSKNREEIRMTKIHIPDETENSTLDLMDFKESRELINEVVEQLPPQRKIIYKMNKEQGMNYEQIAEKLNISKNTVRNQLVEALKFIRERLQNPPGAAVTLLSIWIKIHS